MLMKTYSFLLYISINKNEEDKEQLLSVVDSNGWTIVILSGDKSVRSMDHY